MQQVHSAPPTALAVACLALVAPSVLAAAPQTTSPLPVEVTAAPSQILAGGHVTLHGTTVPAGPESRVTVRVQPPGTAAPVTLEASPGADRTWAVVMTETASPGTYQVQATAPDGKGHASTTFRVVSVSAIPAETGRVADSLVVVSQRVLDAVGQALGDLPPSLQRSEAEQRRAAADARMEEAHEAVVVLREQTLAVFQARAEVPEDNPQWDAYVTELEVWREGARDRSEGLESRLRRASVATQRCGRLDQYVEMLTLVSEALNYAILPFDFSRGFWIDKIPPAFVARADPSGSTSPEARFLAVTTMKTAATALEGPQGVLLAIPGLVTDFAQFMVQQEFSRFCEKFEGPISATFLGESFTTDGEPFFDYTTVLDGKLVLMYEKGADPDRPVVLLGYMEGSGRFEVRDNPAPIVRLTPGTVLFHTVLSPPGGRYWDELGQASRSLLPHSFRIPVRGVLAGDSIVLEVEPAIHDFGETIQGRSIYVVVPLGAVIPQVIDSPISLQKAHSILSRAIRRHPVLRVEPGKGGSVARGVIQRDTTNASGTARVRTQLTLEACNPGCLPLPVGGGR